MNRLLACLVIICLTCFAAVAPGDASATLNERELAKALASSRLTQEQQILHVLNRLGYGPRPGDIKNVKTLGLAEYISRQLEPERIDDSALTQRLERLETIQMSSSQLAALYPRRPQPPQQRPDMNDEEAQKRMAEQRQEMRGVRKIGLELQQAKILRATYSERQLQEVMADFWFNHFNVFIGKGADRVLTTEYDREVIRANALSNFRELLAASAKSPAMLFYLDNWMSIDPNAKLPERLNRARFPMAPNARNKPQKPAPKRARGLNENYARELMELHTLGVDGGYTQKDVTEVARCFTGWTMRNPQGGGSFQFVNMLHDNGEKTVLGKTIPAGGGMKDGELVIEMLANHPSTASFISTKLCRRFVSDTPPEALVKRCAEKFQKTGGDIRQVLAVIFTSPEFYSPEAYRAKVKKPLELVVSALRATSAETVAPPSISVSLRSMGEMLYGCQPPTGYPDTADAWVNTGALLERMNFATALANGDLAGTRMRLGNIESKDTAGLIAKVSRELLQENPKPAFISGIQKQLEAAESGNNNVATIAGLILGSPEFQRR
jgi:uncharacterized protein (DUF1800 family)